MLKREEKSLNYWQMLRPIYFTWEVFLKYSDCNLLSSEKACIHSSKCLDCFCAGRKTKI